MQQAANDLLHLCWTTDWLISLGTSRKKAYKVINEKQVQLAHAGRMLYLPSRVRRGIAEWAGRTLRSQYKRYQCYQHVQAVLQQISLEENIDTLVQTVAQTIYLQYNVGYKWQLIRQQLRTFRKWHYRYSFDLSLLEYIHLVEPKLHNFVFPYSPTDDQAIQYTMHKAYITLEMKLPVNPTPYQTRDWKWFKTKLTIPKALQKRIAAAEDSKPHLPELRFQRLKGGLFIAILQFSWDYRKDTLDFTFFHKKRVLAVDLGQINLATSVVCEAGSQITPPIFYDRDTTVYTKIERIYGLITQIQKKIRRYAARMPGQHRRAVEISRLHLKTKHQRQQELSNLVNYLLDVAGFYGCATIVLENLGSYKPSANGGKWSRRLNNWLRGNLFSSLQERGNRSGWKVTRVNPRGTSSYCPRCTKRGRKVRTYNSTEPNEYGRCFYCAHCGYRADRDCIGAINIYRMHQEKSRKIYWLSSARPVFYRNIGLPPYRSGGKVVIP